MKSCLQISQGQLLKIIDLHKLICLNFSTIDKISVDKSTYFIFIIFYFIALLLYKINIIVLLESFSFPNKFKISKNSTN